MRSCDASGGGSIDSNGVQDPSWLGAVRRGGMFSAERRVLVAGQQAVQEDVDNVSAGRGIAALARGGGAPEHADHDLRGLGRIDGAHFPAADAVLDRAGEIDADALAPIAEDPPLGPIRLGGRVAEEAQGYEMLAEGRDDLGGEAGK